MRAPDVADHEALRGRELGEADPDHQGGAVLHAKVELLHRELSRFYDFLWIVEEVGREVRVELRQLGERDDQQLVPLAHVLQELRVVRCLDQLLELPDVLQRVVLRLRPRAVLQSGFLRFHRFPYFVFFFHVIKDARTSPVACGLMP